MSETATKWIWLKETGKKVLGTPRGFINLGTSVARNTVGTAKDLVNVLIRRPIFWTEIEDPKTPRARGKDIINKGTDALLGIFRSDETAEQRKARQKEYFSWSKQKALDMAKKPLSGVANLAIAPVHYAKAGASLIRNTVGIGKDAIYGLANFLWIKSLKVDTSRGSRIGRIRHRTNHALSNTLTAKNPKENIKEAFSKDHPLYGKSSIAQNSPTTQDKDTWKIVDINNKKTAAA